VRALLLKDNGGPDAILMAPRAVSPVITGDPACHVRAMTSAASVHSRSCL
jgi:hypothetical protein